MTHFALLPGLVAMLGFSATPALAAPACPAKDIRGFVAAFSESVEIQRAFTATPFVFEYVDNSALPEPQPRSRTLSAKELNFPLMPTRAVQQRQKLEPSFRAMPDGAQELKLALPDTGYQLRFLFKKAGDCWTLVRKSDDSF